LPIVTPEQQPQQQSQNFAPPAPAFSSGSSNDSNFSAPQGSDIIGAIERLAQLHQRGILSDDEFRSKKAELLSRL